MYRGQRAERPSHGQQPERERGEKVEHTKWIDVVSAADDARKRAEKDKSIELELTLELEKSQATIPKCLHEQGCSLSVFSRALTTTTTTNSWLHGSVDGGMDVGSASGI